MFAKIEFPAAHSMKEFIAIDLMVIDLNTALFVSVIFGASIVRMTLL